MNHKHTIPSACSLNSNIWVFSMYFIEKFDGKIWHDIIMPFTARFLPFQYVLPVNEE